MTRERAALLIGVGLVAVWIPFALVREAEYGDSVKADATLAGKVSADSAVACSDSARAAQLAAPPVLLPDSTRPVCVYYRTPHIRN